MALVEDVIEKYKFSEETDEWDCKVSRMCFMCPLKKNYTCPVYINKKPKDGESNKCKN